MMLKQTNIGIALVLALAVGGCGSDGSAPPPTNQTPEEVQVELFSWWVNPGEAEALQALMDLNKEVHPNERIVNAAEASGTDAKQELSDRLAADDPPDLFQQNAHDMRQFVADNPGKVEQLDDIFTADNLSDVVVAEVLSDVTVDGHVYSMPVNIHRENALFYNKRVFADHDLAPPTTLADFFAACETLKAAGVTPVATSYQGWIIRIMFNSLAQGTFGAEEFGAQWNGAAMDETKLGEAIDNLNRVLTDYSNDTAGDMDFGWTQAADMVFEGDAAMFFHGDWAKGYFVQKGWEPNEDFGVVGAPGAANMFWYGVDVFAMPVGGPEPDAARDFLRTVASIDGQVGFNTVKGSSPMRLDVPNVRLDTMGQEVLLDLQEAQVRSLVRNPGTYDPAFGAYAVDRDKDVLMQVFRDDPPH